MHPPLFHRLGPIVLILAVVFPVVGCNDDDDDVDSPFTTLGFVTHDNAAGGKSDDRGVALTLDSAGKILVAGHSWNGAGDLDMVIWRYHGDGRLDTTFDDVSDAQGPGWVVSDNAAGGALDDVGSGITVDPVTGNIYVTGFSTNGNFDKDMVIWSYLPTGAPNTAFGTAGIVVDDGAAGGMLDDEGAAITLDVAGNILVAGSSANLTPNLDLALWRFDSTGTLDGAFGIGGIAVHDGAAGGAGDDGGEALVVDSMDRVLVAGWSTNGTPDRDLAVWRFDAAGVLDPAFGGQGWVVHDDAAGGAGDDAALGITLYLSGRIAVSGYSTNVTADRDLALWRFGPAGALDATFGGQGWIVHASAAGGGGDDVGRDLILDPSQRLVVAGESRNFLGNQDMVVWRFQIDGSLDPTLNEVGWIVRDNAAGGSGDDVGRGVILSALGSILVAGDSENPSGNQDAAIWAE